MSSASSKSVDFTKVKDGGGQFSKTRMPSGDYLAKVTSVTDAPAKKDGEHQWLFTFQLAEHHSATYPYYCKLVENQLWKLRNLLVAAGLNVPKRKVKVDPTRIIGKTVAVSLEDDEYDGKMQSVIAAVFPAADLDDDGSTSEEEEETEEEEEEETDEEEEEEEEAPPAKKKRSKKKAAEVDDDELEELEIEDL